MTGAIDKAQTPIYIVAPNDPTTGATVTRDATHAAAMALLPGDGCVSGASVPPIFQLDAGSKFQGRSWSIFDCGCPAAIFSSVLLSQA